MDLRVLLGEDISSSEDDLFPYDGIDTSEEEKMIGSDTSSEESACRTPFLGHFGGGTSEESTHPSGNSSSLWAMMEEEGSLDSVSDAVAGGDFTRFGGCGSRRTVIG